MAVGGQGPAAEGPPPGEVPPLKETRALLYEDALLVQDGHQRVLRVKDLAHEVHEGPDGGIGQPVACQAQPLQRCEAGFLAGRLRGPQVDGAVGAPSGGQRCALSIRDGPEQRLPSPAP